MSTGPDEAAEQRIGAVALRLFAELGYDSTDLRMIAEATGISESVVQSVTGGKRALYLRIFRAEIDRALAELESFAAGFTPDVRGMTALYDRYFESSLENPGAASIWMQRSMSDAADVGEVEQIMAPFLARTNDLTAPAFRPGVDVELTNWMIAWFIDCFVVGGVVGPDGEVMSARSPASVRRARRHVHQYLELTTWAAPEPSAEGR
ncbi:TetR/AcrR family transcriptional regulator [Actinocorallia sp. API 0066]|uniref:TetR/AcrR family transcriptional regulator n=1 Tax=Actinocorallia sp. API 0066 TaxID=2896846 RepID=UPI001E481195|nr:TetR/AcrR family transcriptional regulator [Actinocorallia sp. API 0066]MCD0452452.1 TetR/AcrR family transcriptional regulator [Actinocorallia sp. API 0066]